MQRAWPIKSNEEVPGAWQMPPWLGPGACLALQWCPRAGRGVKDLQGQGMGASQQRQSWQCQSKQRVQVRFTVKGKTNY